MITQLGIKIGNQRRRRLIVHEPKCRKGASRSRLDRNARETECCAIVAGGRLARAKREQFHGLFTELAGTKQLLQVVQCELAIER